MSNSLVHHKLNFSPNELYDINFKSKFVNICCILFHPSINYKL